MAVPATIWSARRVIAQNAKIAAPTPPVIMATSSPMNGLPENQVPATAAKAPMSMRPSRAMLVTPERSESRPPMAANTSGAAERSVAVSRATVKKLVSASRGPLPSGQIGSR